MLLFHFFLNLIRHLRKMRKCKLLRFWCVFFLVEGQRKTRNGNFSKWFMKLDILISAIYIGWLCRKLQNNKFCQVCSCFFCATYFLRVCIDKMRMVRKGSKFIFPSESFWKHSLNNTEVRDTFKSKIWDALELSWTCCNTKRFLSILEIRITNWSLPKYWEKNYIKIIDLCRSITLFQEKNDTKI